MAQDLENYPEFLPNLRGWDYRINLPHVQFQRLRGVQGGPVTMAGVIEDSAALDLPACCSQEQIGYRSNSIWLFRVEDGRVLFAQLPSRRAPQSSAVENAASLTGSWSAIGGPNASGFMLQRVAVAVVGKGLGFATVHVVARGINGQLWHNRIVVDRSDITTWPSAWQRLGAASGAPSAAAVASGTVLTVAWVDPAKNLQAKFFNSFDDSWSPAVTVASAVDAFTPRLLSDGTTVHALFSAGDRLRHAFRLSLNPFTFSQPTVVSSFLPVFRGEFDATVFNGGVHAVIRTQTGEPVNSGVFYTSTTSPAGSPASWTIPSDTGLKAGDAPRIASLFDNLFVVAGNGRITYARKDPNSRDNRITGSATADRWLEPGWDIDPPRAGRFTSAETLAFNGDLYLTANANAFQPDASAQIINFGRAAMKQVFTTKWGVRLRIGELGATVRTGFGSSEDIRMVGDFNGDQETDFIRFAQRNVSDVGAAPVFVSMAPAFDGEAAFHTGFSPKGEVPLVGNFDGDAAGFDDIVTFAQKPLMGPDGTVQATAPVYVALSNGSAFVNTRIWHTFFSLKGEVPLVGDFNGDGRDDIASFLQKAHHDPAGNVIAQAPVWVALSDGTKFGPSNIWHNFFSLKGEIPMVGDFNGDGKDDLATFVQKPHLDAEGNVIATAPVWVALTETKPNVPGCVGAALQTARCLHFGQSRIWHTFFAPTGELPRVADMNMDGKDDIVTFLRDRVEGERGRSVLTAYSTGNQFDRSTLYVSAMVGQNDIPYFGAVERKTGTLVSPGIRLGDITLRPEDLNRILPDLFIFEPSGKVKVALALGNVPYANGAPWERYKWFTEKGIGAALFPEWIYTNGPGHCLSNPFHLNLVGSGGSGGEGQVALSQRIGSRAEHVLEELGHSLFSHCLKSNRDPFSLFKSIYETPMNEGGLDANNKPFCDNTAASGNFDECRDNVSDAGAEHFFLKLVKNYRLRGDQFRNRINGGTTLPNETPATLAERSRRFRQYLWIKDHWYHGAEFKAGPSSDPTLMSTYGLLCLPGECVVNEPTLPPPPPTQQTRTQCLLACRNEQRACTTEQRPNVCARIANACRAECPAQ